MNDAKDFLRRYKTLRTKVENKLIEKEQWKRIALSITAGIGGDRVQAAGEPSKMANAVGHCVDLETEIDSVVAELIEEYKKVISALESLDSPVEYDVLHMRYIQERSLQEIADKYGNDYSWATTTHGRAIRNLSEIIRK